MFEAILTQFEPLYKNSELLNIDKLKLVRFNRTTIVGNGSFELLFDEFSDVTVSI